MRGTWRVGPRSWRRASPVASASCTRLDRKSLGWGGCRNTGIGTVSDDGVWARTSVNSCVRTGANGWEEEVHMDNSDPSRRGQEQEATHRHSFWLSSGFGSRVQVTWCAGACLEGFHLGMRRPFSWCATCSCCDPNDGPFGHGWTFQTEGGDRPARKISAQIRIPTGTSLEPTLFWQERYRPGAVESRET